jgi:adenosylcobinamide-phosphate synthase
VALELAPWLAPHAALLAAAVALDLAIGDPEYALHPVRVIGRMLQATERMLRRKGADGYGGGVLLFLALALCSVGGVSTFMWAMSEISPLAAGVAHVFFVYSFLALGDLLRHGRAIERAVQGGDLVAARTAVSKLVGRDTAPMDGAACRRAAVESLSENLTDGFVSPLFWYVIGGVPLLVLFKTVSTMDSMVGYKTPPYLRFGWCGARLDDAMNFVPARVAWLVLSAVAACVPGCSAAKALRVGLAQHATLPGPNAGWSEAAAAGALQRRLVGPIWMNGALVTDVWIGDASDPALASGSDYARASRLVAASGLVSACFAALLAAIP